MLVFTQRILKWKDKIVNFELQKRLRDTYQQQNFTTCHFSQNQVYAKYESSGCKYLKISNGYGSSIFWDTPSKFSQHSYFYELKNTEILDMISQVTIDLI